MGKKWSLASGNLHMHASFCFGFGGQHIFYLVGKLRLSASGRLEFCISQEGFWGYPWTHWEIEMLSMSNICPGMGRGSSSTLEFFPCSVKCCSKCFFFEGDSLSLSQMLSQMLLQMFFFWGGQSKPPLHLFLYLYIYLHIYLYIFYLQI